ncbi:SET and MYND domain-containing protein 4-like [Palaemon carinicauda]|uniref:SET and MYND domain-containing protein 4-like n=1 Tax=Palaemon carinicauda TaxID=392227 RepID=UPI0035B67F76
MHTKGAIPKRRSASRDINTGDLASRPLSPIPETPSLPSADIRLEVSQIESLQRGPVSSLDDPSNETPNIDISDFKTIDHETSFKSKDADTSDENSKDEEYSFISNFSFDTEVSDPVETQEAQDKAHRLCSSDLRNVDSMKENFKKNITAERYKEIKSYFTGRKSEEDLFTTIWNLKECHEYLKITFCLGSKSAEDCSNFLTEADSLRKSNPKLALHYYNQAVLVAPNPIMTVTCVYNCRKTTKGNILSKRDLSDLRNLSHCYTCRSDCLFTLMKYEKCLIDLNLAKIYGSCVGRNKEKIERRRMECIKLLKLAKSNVLLQDSDYELTYTNFVEIFRKVLVTKEKNVISNFLSSPYKMEDLIGRYKPETPIQPMLNSCNATLPRLDSAVGLSCSSIKGRSLIAQRDIDPGEVLAIDSCYASTLYSCNKKSFCCVCFKRCLAAHPCHRCTQVVFCSIDCWLQGMTGDHLLECNQFLHFYVQQNYSCDQAISNLACKILLKEGYPYLSKIITQLRNEENVLTPILKGFNGERKYTSEEFRNVYHMVNHKERLSNSEIFDKCITAYLLLKSLIASHEFFNDINGSAFIPTRKDIKMTGTILLRLLFSLPYNAQEISRYEISETEDGSLPGTVLGAGVFPTLSLINHSCNPTAQVYFDGKKMVLRAITYIPAGEEITYSYIRTYGEMSYSDRKARLKKYHINCRCEACIEKWPLYSDLANIQVPCLNCQSAVSITEVCPTCTKCQLEYKPHKRSQTEWWNDVTLIKMARELYKPVVTKLKVNKPSERIDYSAVRNYVKVLTILSSLPNKQHYCAQHCLQNLLVRDLLHFIDAQNQSPHFT